MKLECAGCKKVLGEDSFDSCHSIFKCRKDHIFACCKVDCRRIFEKRCSKVADNLQKMQHKLNNDGHTSALRRLPPCEREKFKQHAEAESNGLMICPEEVKACERSVPNCAHVVHRSGGYANDDEPFVAQEDDEGAAVPPPPPLGAAQELVSDDMLQELRRDDDGEDEPGPGGQARAKKAQKGRKEKKNVSLLIDWKTPPVNGVTTEDAYADAWAAKGPTAQSKPFSPAPYTPSPARTPGGMGAAQWSAVASRLSEADAAQARPFDAIQKAKTLSGTTGCTDQRAIELLELHNWDLDKAADAFFRQAAGAAERAAEGPRWGPRAQGTQQQQQQQQGTTQHQQQQQQQQQAAPGGPQPPAPSQPPPPRLPPDWQAIWAEGQQAYYFWHVPSNKTTWEAPEAPEDPALRAAQAAAAEAAMRRDALVAEVREITGVDLAAARSLLEAHGWSLEAAVRAHAQRREAAAKRRAEEEAAAAQRLAQEEARRAAEARSEQLARHVGLGHYVCTRHWRPRPGIPGCIRLFHGERVRVTWTDGKEEGWAFGTIVDDPSKEGYFPQALLREVKHQPRGRRAGERCQACERFEAPEEVGGYVGVGLGDVLKVLHTMEEPYVWVYVERLSARGGALPESGWAPECVLGGRLPEAYSGHQGGPGPNPAG